MDNVLVTGIGGVVGQGILRNIIACRYDIRLVGSNTEAISGGNHLCEAVYHVPYSYEPRYQERLKDICRREDIALIIPSTDYEAYYLSAAQNELPPVAGSPAPTAKIFLDKYLTWQEFLRNGIPFAETCLPQDYAGQFSQHITKPREGRGSRGIHINHEQPSRFTSDYIVQRLYRGREITTAFYVTRDAGLHGHITLERILCNGNTVACHVIKEHQEQIEGLIRRMLSAFSIRGSCNVQSIITEKGDVIPFEINCRISGTNSIRAQFGFKDVKYTIDELLYNRVPEVPCISPGAATRIFMDVIYPGSTLEDVKDSRTEHYLF